MEGISMSSGQINGKYIPSKGSIRKLKKQAKLQRVRHNILKSILDEVGENSNIVNKAKFELELIGYKDSSKGPNKWIRENVLELLQLFSHQGHSGFSAGYCINLFTKLAKFENLSELTLSDEEFSKSMLDGDYQNIRKSSVFKDNKGIYDIDAFTKNPVNRKLFGETKVISGSFGNWSGSLLESNGGIATGRSFRRCYFKQVDIDKKRLPKGNFVIPCLEVEVKPDDWLMFVDVNQAKYKELQELYDIDYKDVPTIKGKNILELTENHGY